MKMRLLLLVCGIVSLMSCNTGDQRLLADVTGIQIPETRIHRYELDLFRSDTMRLQSELERLRPVYPFFLDTDLSDPEKLFNMRDYLGNIRNRAAFQAVAKKYSDLKWLGKELHDLLLHFKYYNPDFQIPRIYTYISGGDFEYPVQFADSVLLIGIDNFLGDDFSYYKSEGVPAYRLARMQASEILPECARVLVRVNYPAQFAGNNLLEQILEAGKKLYLAEIMAPRLADRLKIGYSEIQYNWMVKNEKNVWAAMVSNGLLFSTDGQVIRSFFSDGPYTPEFSKESPPRMGEWFGWKIVSLYMQKNPDISLSEMMAERDAQKVLSTSGYKPGR